MDEQELLRLKPELDQFLDRFAPLFGRDENEAHARRFVQGLLRGGERRNAENIAEAMDGGAGPHPPGVHRHRGVVGSTHPGQHGVGPRGRAG